MPTNEQPHQLPPSEENLGEVEILAVSETITATHTLTLYDAAGTAYKVPCVAA